jgi:hypothetical protein
MLLGLADLGAGLDAERLGLVAGGDAAGGVGHGGVTASGLPRYSGWSCCSTDAKKLLRSMWRKPKRSGCRYSDVYTLCLYRSCLTQSHSARRWLFFCASLNYTGGVKEFGLLGVIIFAFCLLALGKVTGKNAQAMTMTTVSILMRDLLLRRLGQGRIEALRRA